MSALRTAGSTRRWRRIRVAILERDRRRCQWPGLHTAPAGTWSALYGTGSACLAPAGHVDHVVERIAGGNDRPENLRAACADHNLARGAGTDDRQLQPRRSSTRWSW